MRKLEFRKLTADEIDCRVGTISKKGFSLLLYKDARCDQNVLDETVGAFNWQRDHKEIKGNLYCGVAIWDEEKSQWILKWDCGVESNTEKEKGEASDSFKRACFNWGIGRELYTAPFIWISGNVEENAKGNLVPTFKSFKVVRLEYNDNHISALTISGDGEVIFEWGSKKQQHAEPKVEQPKKAQSTAEPALTLEDALNTTTSKGTPFYKLSDEYLQKVIEQSSDPKRIAAAKLILEDHKACPDLLPIDEPIEAGLPF